MHRAPSRALARRDGIPPLRRRHAVGETSRSGFGPKATPRLFRTGGVSTSDGSPGIRPRRDPAPRGGHHVVASRARGSPRSLDGPRRSPSADAHGTPDRSYGSRNGGPLRGARTGTHRLRWVPVHFLVWPVGKTPARPASARASSRRAERGAPLAAFRPPTPPDTVPDALRLDPLAPASSRCRRQPEVA